MNTAANHMHTIILPSVGIYLYIPILPFHVHNAECATGGWHTASLAREQCTFVVEPMPKQTHLKCMKASRFRSCWLHYKMAVAALSFVMFPRNTFAYVHLYV